MRFLFILIGLIATGSRAQQLVFDKTNVESVDKWVVYPSKVEGTYAFGFIYIDADAGLTFAFEDTFKTGAAGKIERIASARTPNSGSAKVRIGADDQKLAQLSDAQLGELGVDKVPKWLAIYKAQENTAHYQYRLGYLYNEWNQPEKALSYLEKADKIQPDFKSLQTEMAFSYNALQQYEKAEAALKKALQYDAKDCYALKELAYVYNQSGDFAKGAAVYAAMKDCSEKSYVMETAYNLAARYFENKDKANFDKWAAETRKFDAIPKYLNNIDAMEKQLAK